MLVFRIRLEKELDNKFNIDDFIKFYMINVIKIFLINMSKEKKFLYFLIMIFIIFI